MMQIKKLPLFGVGESVSTTNQSVTSANPNAATAASVKKGGLNASIFVIGLLLSIFAIGYFVYTVMYTYPQPQDVLKKQVVYHFDGKVAMQDSNPIPMSESNFFYITDEYIDYFNPIDAMRYWELVKDGPAMSMNFRENYQTFKDYYYLRCVGTGILVFIALSVLCSSFFLGQTKTVGTRQGSEWK